MTEKLMLILITNTFYLFTDNQAVMNSKTNNLSSVVVLTAPIFFLFLGGLCSVCCASCSVDLLKQLLAFGCLGVTRGKLYRSSQSRIPLETITPGKEGMGGGSSCGCQLCIRPSQTTEPKWAANAFGERQAVEQIGEELGRSPDTVRRVIQRAKTETVSPLPPLNLTQSDSKESGVQFETLKTWYYKRKVYPKMATLKIQQNALVVSFA